MAIQKAKTMTNGAEGNYWRIINITIDRQNLKAHAQIALFKDQATSTAGKPPLGMIKTFHFTFTVMELTTSMNIISYVYGKIVAIAETMITKDVLGNDLDVPVAFDPDIAGGTPV